MQQNKYVLAMYDVRGKQDFIFRTNKIQEIIGASWFIRDVFKDYLYPIAEKYSVESKGIFSYMGCKGDSAFSPDAFEKHLSDDYIGEVVYEGGGNFILLFKDMKTFKGVTYLFTKKLYEVIGTIRVLGTAVEIDNFGDYKSDIARLYAEHRVNEAQESKVDPWGCLPIVQVNRSTSQPLVDYEECLKEQNITLSEKVKETIKTKGEQGKLTKEAFAKLLKFHLECERIRNGEAVDLTDIERDFFKENEKILDNLAEERGEDSLLAVVYIDGNNMGAQVQSATEGKVNYAESIEALRAFSKKIQEKYVEEGIKSALSTISQSKDSFRVVVSAGDEVNFIVKAKDAFGCAVGYLNNLKGTDGSACAGISVFHSHAPYSDAYRIAEEACESGKSRMKELKLERAAFIDFHIGQGAYGTSLEAIREMENGDLISRPWFIWGDVQPCGGTGKDCATLYSDIERLSNLLNEYARSNVKGLAKASKMGNVELELELNRIYAHAISQHEKDTDEAKRQETLKKENEWLQNLDSEYRRRLIYDISISYDLWLKESDEKKDDVKKEGEN